LVRENVLVNVRCSRLHNVPLLRHYLQENKKMKQELLLSVIRD
jgi:hypothetical protein